MRGIVSKIVSIWNFQTIHKSAKMFDSIFNPVFQEHNTSDQFFNLANFVNNKAFSLKFKL